jgi:glycerol uptake facilitator-like aquaporin
VQENSLNRRLAAEFCGTAFLLATVVGSGIMAERLAGGNIAIALLGNTIPTGAILVVLITALGPVSGAHFNPAVTLAFLVRREIRPAAAGLYLTAQFAGAVAGTLLAHAMFEMPLLQVSSHIRTGSAQWLSEAVATFGLVGTIFAALRWRPDGVAWMVGLYITAAYWFTASTSFANPAVTLARSLTDTFSGIRPLDAPNFIIAQCLAGILAALALGWLLHPKGYPQAGAGRQRDAAAGED